MALTLVISGCTGLKPVETVTEAFESGNASQCESIEDVNIRSTCYAGAAVTGGDVNVCTKIVRENDRVTCIVGVAVSTMNESLCDNINESKRRDSCHKVVQKIQGSSSEELTD